MNFKEFKEQRRESKIINEIRKNLDRTDLLKGLSMNNIKHHAACLVAEGDLSYEFYRKVFIVKEGYKPFWEVESNLKYIKNFPNERQKGE